MKPSGLEEKSKEILDHAKNQGFSIFYSKELSADYDLEAIWDRPEEWREFFNIAKNEDVKTIIANIQVFEKDDAFRIEGADHFTIEDVMNKAVANPEELSEIDGKVGLYKFSWIKKWHDILAFRNNRLVQGIQVCSVHCGIRTRKTTTYGCIDKF